MGTLSSSGVYSAPSSITVAKTITVKASSTVDPTRSATATVTLTPSVLIALTPLTAALTTGQTKKFTATVKGTTNTDVAWTLNPAVGSISAVGLYTPPAVIAAVQTVKVTATSVADPTKSASASVALTPSVIISLTPLTAALKTGQTKQFTATVKGTTNTNVSWTLSPTVGSISTAGLYTPPAVISAAQTVTVKATSVADPTKSANATVTLAPPVSISLTPLSTSLAVAQTQQFTAMVGGTANGAVTWTISPATGSISASGLYTAPATIPIAQSVIVNATSVADPTKFASATVALQGPTLRQMAAQRAILIGTAATADEFPAKPNPLNEPAYAATLGTQYSMLSPGNALKWPLVHPEQSTYNFEPADQLVAFAEAHSMQVRGHTLSWYAANPDWLNNFAKTASPSAMARLLQDHITTVVTRYRGRIFAWDVVNEAVSDWATGVGPDLQDSIWYNRPGIGLSGTGYIEQAFRWAHAADPSALLFYNDYGIEDAGPKFESVFNLVQTLLAHGVPIHGVGLQMHLDISGYPTTSGLAQNIQRLAALGLQVHITEMDVRIPVGSNGTSSTADLQAQAETYQRILTTCLQSSGCTAFQTWEFSDKYSWIPYYYSGFGAALPFAANYQRKPAVDALMTAFSTAQPVLKSSAIVNGATYQAGPVAPGEFVVISGANYGPANLIKAKLDLDQAAPPSLDGTQVLFDGYAAPLIYSVAGQIGAMVPYHVSGKRQTSVQFTYRGVTSNVVTVPVAPAALGVFSADLKGKGAGSILNQDLSLNSQQNPAHAGSVVRIVATGGGIVAGGAIDGGLAPVKGSQILPVTAAIGNLPAVVVYAGPAPGKVNGLLQVELVVPAELAPGIHELIIMAGGVASQSGITIAVN